MKRAIETLYRGHIFRSRLEARWAVFFTGLGIEYEYEPEGFDLDGVWYLPDFKLPRFRDGHDLWVEIKPKGAERTGMENVKHAAFARNLDEGDAFVVLDGDPWRNIEQDYALEWVCTWREGVDHPFLFCVCPWCLKAGFEFDGRGARVCGYQAHHDSQEEAMAALPEGHDHWRVDDKCYTSDHPRIVIAATAARQERFGT